MNDNTSSLLEIFLNDSSFKNWANQSNRNDMEFWESWLEKHPEKAETMYTAKAIITGIAFQKTIIQEDKIQMELAAVLKQIEGADIKREKKAIKGLRNLFPIKFQKYAAIAAVSLLFIVLGKAFLEPSSEVIHKTGFGEIINLKLPDGTTVVLNGNSEIKYTKDDARNIALKGEAYFNVQSIPSTNAKFWVTTDDLQVEVYGTQFHVNTHELKTDVLLDEGSIHLLLENGTTKKMAPGEIVSFSKKKNAVMHEKVTRELSYSTWREGTYVFNNVILEEVMKNVEQSYGLKVQFLDEALKQHILTGGIPNHNLKICLAAIEKSTGTRIVQKDNSLLLYKDTIN